MLRGSPVRVLDDRDLAVVRELLDRDPVANVFVTARLESAGLDPWRLGAEVWGHVPAGRVVALCYAGANLVPVACQRRGLPRIRRKGPQAGTPVLVDRRARPIRSACCGRCSNRHGGHRRDVRAHQPLMAISDPPRIAPDPLVRRVRPDELEILYPACVAMFTEEVGVSPANGDGGSLYRARVGELIGQGRAFARIEDGRVVFKAEVGAATAEACQIQGVWVDPRLRGRGYANGGMAAVVAHAQATSRRS